MRRGSAQPHWPGLASGLRRDSLCVGLVRPRERGPAWAGLRTPSKVHGTSGRLSAMMKWKLSSTRVMSGIVELMPTVNAPDSPSGLR